MRVVIPCTKLGFPSPGRGLSAATAAFGSRVGARFVDVSGSDFAYYELLKELWHAGETFMYVEHDVVPEDALMPEMWNCPEEYCTPGSSSEVCAKFGEGLMRRWPNLLEEMGPLHWGAVTLVLSSELCRRGVQPHPHDHAVEHPGGGMRGQPDR
jgi:hypothetical protein